MHASDGLERDGGRFHALNPLRRERNPPRIHEPVLGPAVLKKMANQSLENSGAEHLGFFPLKLIGQSRAVGSKACRQQVKVIRWDYICFF